MPMPRELMGQSDEANRPITIKCRNIWHRSGYETMLCPECPTTTREEQVSIALTFIRSHPVDVDTALDALMQIGVASDLLFEVRKKHLALLHRQFDGVMTKLQAVTLALSAPTGTPGDYERIGSVPLTGNWQDSISLDVLKTEEWPGTTAGHTYRFELLDDEGTVLNTKEVVAQ